MPRSSQTTPKKPVRKKVRVRKKPGKKIGNTASPLSRNDVIAHVAREPIGHLLVEKLLRDNGFTGNIASDRDTLTKYSTDESIFSIRPQIVLYPKSEHDVEIAVRVLEKEAKRFPALSLTARAAGTGLSGGSLTDSIVIDTCSFLSRIDEIKTSSSLTTITCEPGAMWRDVEAILQKQGYYLPPYPASKDICSIGGAVANNSAGPDSLRYGQVARWVQELRIVLKDGNTYTVRPLSYKDFKKVCKEKNELGRIANEVFAVLESNERAIRQAQPKTQKNTAGYALWNVLSTSVKEFKRGIGTFDLTQLIVGSQGTLGIITQVTLRAEPIKANTKLLVVPVFDLQHAGTIVEEALKHNPINIEVFDDLTFDLSLKNPNFFRSRLSGITYYKTLLAMYTTYHVRYRQKLPAFTLLITLDEATLTDERLKTIYSRLQQHAPMTRVVTNPFEAEMLWQMRRASYLLSKLQDPTKRPAAFLEDMIVPPKHLARFFTEIKRLLKQYNVTSAIHGHGGDGHFHFYPLLDFTRKSTPQLIIKMANDFFKIAIKYEGSICGEHNDGIMRTPYLSKMFSKNILNLFTQIESIFDPDDIFNPGKKVHPRFDIKNSIRTTN